jgi:hypothetical protein
MRDGEGSYQFTHERAARKVALQEHNQVPLRQEKSAAENHHSRLPANRLVESVETSRRQHEPAHIRQQRKQVYDQRNSRFLAKPHEERLQRRVRILVLVAVRAPSTVQFQVRVVLGSQVVGVLALVFLVVGLVDPGERVHEHVVEGRGDVAHEGHEEEGHLQDGVLDEVDAVDDVGVPCYLGEVDEEAEELDEEADADGLREMLVCGVLYGLVSIAHRYSQEDSDHYACQHGQCCLLVMLAGEQAWVLECS